MLYQKIYKVALGTYAFLSAFSHGSTYYVKSAPSSDYQCPSNTTSSSSCHIYCDEDSNENHNIYDCNDVDHCYFHCDERLCGANSIINATNANNLHITQASAGQQCLEYANITTPNNGNAYLSSNSKKGFRYMTLYAGTNAQRIIIDTKNAKEEDKKNNEYEGMKIYAGTATYFNLTLGNKLEWNKGFVECPINSSYDGPDIAPCMIDATSGSLTDVTIIAPDGIPKNVWIPGCKSCSNVQIHCNNADTLNGANEYNISAYPFNAASDCWWTNHPTNDPTLSPSAAPSNSPTEVTISPTAAPSSAPSLAPSNSPTKLTISPTAAPSLAPSLAPSTSPSQVTQSPSAAPSLAPSIAPSNSPTHVTQPPSAAPSLAPSVAPSVAPSIAPSLAPSLAPSVAPSVSPSFAPSLSPSISPSLAPTLAPSLAPSLAPTLAPTLAPSLAPSLVPSLAPSLAPTLAPTLAPSLAPSSPPTRSPSPAPSLTPSSSPSNAPTNAPTLAPTIVPSRRTHAPTNAPSATPTTSPFSENEQLVTEDSVTNTLFFVFACVILVACIAIIAFIVWCARKHTLKNVFGFVSDSIDSYMKNIDTQMKNTDQQKKNTYTYDTHEPGEAIELGDNQSQIQRIISDSFVKIGSEEEKKEDGDEEKEIEYHERERKMTDIGEHAGETPQYHMSPINSNEVMQGSVLMTKAEEDETVYINCNKAGDQDDGTTDSEDLYGDIENAADIMTPEDETPGRISVDIKNIPQQDEKSKSVVVAVAADNVPLPQQEQAQDGEIDYEDLIANRISEAEKVTVWMRDKVQLPEYTNTLLRNGYDCMDTVADITAEDLKIMGIHKLGHVRKIVKHAKKLNDN